MDPKNSTARLFVEGTPIYEVKPKDNLVRILPPTWKNHEHCGLDIWVHGSRTGYILCPSRMLNKPCAVCDAAKRFSGPNHLRSKQMVSFLVIDRHDPAWPQVLTMSWVEDRDLAKLAYDDKTGKVLLVDNPDDGYDISFTASDNPPHWLDEDMRLAPPFLSFTIVDRNKAGTPLLPDTKKDAPDFR